MITTLIAIVILIVMARNIVNSMLESYMAHNVVKTALCVILFQIICLVSVLVIFFG